MVFPVELNDIWLNEQRPKSKITEADICDHLAAHLDLIEPGLTLVDTEFHLPNAEGASGFLDIFARAADGQLVIIEIKRTDKAAREANTVADAFELAGLK